MPSPPPCTLQRGRSAAAIVEVNSETDFVARNDMFASLVGRAAAAALDLPAPSLGAGHQADFDKVGGAATEPPWRMVPC